MKKINFIFLNFQLIVMISMISLESLSQSADDVIIKHYNQKFTSIFFNEERDLFIQHIYNETNHEDAMVNKTPVILILDPHQLYNYTAGLIKYLQYNMDIPSFILVGVPNKSRNEELDLEGDGLFSKYINVEVDSVLRKLFPNKGNLHAIGYSNSADFVLYNKINNVSSACILSGLLYTREDYDVFNVKDRIPLYCYSGTEDYRINFVKNLNSLKERDNLRYSNITTALYEGRDHNNIPLSGIEDYIKNEFKQYISFTENELIKVISSETKINTLDSLIRLKTKQFNFDFSPSVNDILFFEEMVDSSEFESFFTHLVSLKLKDLNKLFALNALGEYYEKQNNLGCALEIFQKMYSTIEFNPLMKPQVDGAVQRIEEQLYKKKRNKK